MLTRQELLDGVGRGRWVSPYRVLGQAEIDAFAKLSGDHAFLHVDPVRASDTAFGGTIAHGMLVLSVMTGLIFEHLPQVVEANDAVSYGFERVAFQSPVPAGAAIRALFEIESVRSRGRNNLMVRLQCRVEVESSSRPALTADWDILYRF